ncbi:MAG: hypothetical protein QW534_01360 [Candidatus Methanomethylicia archaeon]
MYTMYEDKCDGERVLMLMKSIVYMLNKIWINKKIKLRIHRNTKQNRIINMLS